MSGKRWLNGHHEQEREQHLDAGQRDAQLLEELLEIAVEPLLLGLVSARARRGFPHRPMEYPPGAGLHVPS